MDYTPTERQVKLTFTHGCTEFHQQILPTLPKQFNSLCRNVISKSKRQPRLGLLCHHCEKRARKQGHNEMINFIKPFPNNV